MKKILGLDISSSTIGWGIICLEDFEISLESYGYIKPLSKKKADKNGLGFISRLDSGYKAVYNLIKENTLDEIVIEDFAKGFSNNKTTANTIITLASFNNIIGLSCLHATGKEAFKYPVISMRSSVSKNFGIDIKSKDDVFPFIDNNFKNFKPSLTRYGNIKKEHFDESDGIFTALAHIVINNKEKKFKIR